MADLGIHTYPVNGRFTTYGDPDCHVQYDHTYTVALADQPPTAR